MRNPSITTGEILLRQMEDVFSRHRAAALPLSVLAVDASAAGEDRLLVPALMGLLAAHTDASFHAFADGKGFRALLPGVDENEARQICGVFLTDVNTRLPASHQFDIAIGLARPNPNSSLETLFRVAWEGSKVARYRRGSSVVHTMVYRSVQHGFERHLNREEEHDEAAWTTAPNLLAITPEFSAPPVASPVTLGEPSRSPEPEPTRTHPQNTPSPDPEHAPPAPVAEEHEISPDEMFDDASEPALEEEADTNAVEIALDEQVHDDDFDLPLEEMHDDELAALLPEEEIAEKSVYMAVAVDDYVHERAFDELVTQELLLDDSHQDDSHQGDGTNETVVGGLLEEVVEAVEEVMESAPYFEESIEAPDVRAHGVEWSAEDSVEELGEETVGDSAVSSVEEEPPHEEELVAVATPLCETAPPSAAAPVAPHVAAPEPVSTPTPVSPPSAPAAQSSPAPPTARRTSSRQDPNDLFDQLCYGFGDESR